MTIKFVQYPHCNACDKVIVDLKKAFRLTGKIKVGDGSGVDQSVHDDGDKVFHAECLRNILRPKTERPLEQPLPGDAVRRLMSELERAEALKPPVMHPITQPDLPPPGVLDPLWCKVTGEKL